VRLTVGCGRSVDRDAALQRHDGHAAANWSTAAGAACFLACAAATLRTGHTVKAPWVSRLERTVERLV
jgi:hypothetical protein